MFFQTIFQRMSTGLDYKLTISRTENEITVIVLPKAKGLKDSAQFNILPFTMTSTPEEVDRAFFSSLSQPLVQTSKLLTNMADFEKSCEEAANKSKAAKSKKDLEEKEAKKKSEKHQKHVKQAEEHEAAGRLEDAATSYKQARLHGSEKEIKAVDKKIAELTEILSQGTLFATAPDNKTDTPAVEVVPDAGAVNVTQPHQPALQNTDYMQTEPGYQGGYVPPQPEGYPPQSQSYYPQPEYQAHPVYNNPPQGYPHNGAQPPHYPENGWQPPIANPVHREGEYDRYPDFPATNETY